MNEFCYTLMQTYTAFVTRCPEKEKPRRQEYEIDLLI